MSSLSPLRFKTLLPVSWCFGVGSFAVFKVGVQAWGFSVVLTFKQPSNNSASALACCWTFSGDPGPFDLGVKLT